MTDVTGRRSGRDREMYLAGRGTSCKRKFRVVHDLKFSAGGKNEEGTRQERRRSRTKEGIFWWWIFTFSFVGGVAQGGLGWWHRQ